MLHRQALSLHQPPKIVWLSDATHGPGTYRYCLPAYWALHFYRYSAKIILDGERYEVEEGSITLQPPGMVSQYHWRSRSRHTVAHFQLPMVADHSARRLPAFLPSSRLRPEHEALIRRGGCWPQTPARATASLWELLWLLAEDFGEPCAPMPHPAILRATRFIEKHVAEPITIEAVVIAAEVSHNHLIRLFRAAYGLTIAAYLRGRRMDRAHHLLTRTTLPIKAVAIECGVPDLQAFNKLVRRTHGLSPTQLRAGKVVPRQPPGHL